MLNETHSKVQARHLKRNAYVYVRQSTLRQVLENAESTKRQYALRERATALGWHIEQIVVIDSDLGQSGASAVDRAGFQRLVTEVGLGRAGIVIGLEVSRLARNSTDWHRLLEICALADVLIGDEDGIYDPAHFNDRLLLGLKGTMSEAELHVLRARLRGGILNKARRGELGMRLPIGFEYGADESGVRLDPDLRIQESIRHLFRTFRRTGSATATVKAFRDEGLTFPHRVYRGPQKGDVVWGKLDHSRVLFVLHHPRYAGAFCFGRTRSRKHPDNRLVADSLEAEWNQALRALTAAQENYEKQCQANRAGLNEKQRADILALASDFPRLWNDPHTSDRERKRMARLLIADVTLLKDTQIRAQVRFNGGATHTLSLPLPRPAWKLWQTPPTVVAKVDQLLEDYTDGEIAHLLNSQGLTAGKGGQFYAERVRFIIRNYGLKSRYDRLLERGLLTLEEMAKILNVKPHTIKVWRRAGLLRAYRYSEHDQYLFERPGANAPVKYQHQGKTAGKPGINKPNTHSITT